LPLINLHIRSAPHIDPGIVWGYRSAVFVDADHACHLTVYGNSRDIVPVRIAFGDIFTDVAADRLELRFGIFFYNPGGRPV